MARNLLITVEEDEASNPADADSQWRLYSFHRDHASYRDPADFFPYSLGFRRKVGVGLAFVLDYYEHGNCMWSLHGAGPQCQWDTSRRAGVLVWEHPPQHMGAKTYGARAADARAFLAEYNSWCNGEGYAFTVEDVDTDGLLDSCSGFNGTDYMVAVIAENIEPGDNIECAGLAGDLLSSIRRAADVRSVRRACPLDQDAPLGIVGDWLEEHGERELATIARHLG